MNLTWYNKIEENTLKSMIDIFNQTKPGDDKAIKGFLIDVIRKLKDTFYLWEEDYDELAGAGAQIYAWNRMTMYTEKTQTFEDVYKEQLQSMFEMLRDDAEFERDYNKPLTNINQIEYPEYEERFETLVLNDERTETAFLEVIRQIFDSYFMANKQEIEYFVK